jgi:predicted alpha/beta-hydrolase family hydrolase
MTRNHDALTFPTPRGDALLKTDRPVGLLRGWPAPTALLFHGAGGGMDAPVLLAVRDALVDIGWTVARLDQPYRVAGRRAPAPAHHLDEVALLAVDLLRAKGPLVLGGKSSGARVACRIAARAGAAGVVAFGFPLHPPGRPEKTRAPELLGAGVPVHVIQGERDAFGTADDLRKIHDDVYAVAGADHALRAKAHVDDVARETARWVTALQAST